MSGNGEAERREYLFRNGARHALLLANSEVGVEDIVASCRAHGVMRDRVAVVPYLPPPYLLAQRPTAADVQRVRAAYGLLREFLFYPAQFWPHKNHARLVKALGLLKREGVEILLVCTGTWSGALRARTHAEVLRLARAEGVEGPLRLTGYVPNEDMAPLYAAARGLVFLTFLGPTNIPILEAWAHGCPVLTSDIRGMQEQWAVQRCWRIRGPWRCWRQA